MAVGRGDGFVSLFVRFQVSTYPEKEGWRPSFSAASYHAKTKALNYSSSTRVRSRRTAIAALSSKPMIRIKAFSCIQSMTIMMVAMEP